MSEKKLTVKEKAKLYDNWLKFVDGKGYTEIFAEPQKIKEKLDNLNKSITGKEKMIGDLLHAQSVFKRQKRTAEEEVQQLKADVRHERETVEIANRQYIDLNQKLEKFKEYNFELKRWTGDDFEWAFNQVKDKFKEILEEK